jgi:hypothetical protein
LLPNRSHTRLEAEGTDQQGDGDLVNAQRQWSGPMTAQTEGSERWSFLGVRRVWPAVLVAALLLWMAIVAGRGSLLVVQSFGPALIGEPEQSVA